MAFDMSKLERNIGWLAVIGPALAIGSITLCILESPWFDWQDNAISDLGVHSVAPLFNSSLMTCGLMCAAFAIFATLRPGKHLFRLGMLTFFLASASLVGIGAFPEDQPPYHYQFSVAFFVLLLLAALALGLLFILKRETRMLGLFAILVAALGVFGWAYHFTVGWGSNVAIPEVLTFGPGAVWSAMLGMWHVRREKAK
jgi:hypothetical membrane protein